MPFVEFSKIDDAGERTLVPDGVYTAVVDDIEETRTRAGDDMWRVALRIAGGENNGTSGNRRIYDNWVFSERALRRLKLISQRFGIDVSEDREITPRDFLGKEIQIEVRTRRRAYDGASQYENFVPYAGYRTRNESPPRDDIPF